MKQKKIFAAVFSAMCLFVGYAAYTQYERTPKDELFLENVEALTCFEVPEDYGWFCMHINCFDSNGNETGKCSASSYPGNKDNPSQYSTPHSHGCSSCCSSCD